MAQSYRLMANAAGDLEILSADGSPLEETLGLRVLNRWLQPSRVGCALDGAS